MQKHFACLVHTFDIPGTTLGVFKVGRVPQLIHYEQCPDLGIAHATGQRMVGDDPIFSIHHNSTEFLQSDQFDEQNTDATLITADYFIGGTIIRTVADRSLISSLPTGPVLAETQCIVTAFRTAYWDKLGEYDRVVHVFQSKNQIDLFVYFRGEPVLHLRELPEHEDRVSYLAAVETLLEDKDQLYRPDGVDMLVFGGGNPYVNLRERGLFHGELLADMVIQFDASGLFENALSDDARRIVNQENSHHHLSGVPTVMAGGYYALVGDWGADFRQIVSSRPPAVEEISRWEKTKTFFQNSFAGDSKASYLKSALIWLLVVTLALGLQYYAKNAAAKQEEVDLTSERDTREGNLIAKREAEQMALVFDGVSKRSEVYNQMLEAELTPYVIAETLRAASPNGVRLSRVLITQQRVVTVNGYVSSANAGEGQKSADGTPPTLTTNAIDFANPVVKYINNLSAQKYKGQPVFKNIQNPYAQTSADKSEFTITCEFAGPVLPDVIKIEPIPPVLRQFSKPNPGGPAASPAK